MRITYDPEADALAIVLQEASTLRDSVDLEEGVTAFLDPQGHFIGLEVLDARRRFGRSLDTLTLEEVPEVLHWTKPPERAKTRMVGSPRSPRA